MAVSELLYHILKLKNMFPLENEAEGQQFNKRMLFPSKSYVENPGVSVIAQRNSHFSMTKVNLFIFVCLKNIRRLAAGLLCFTLMSL